METESSLDQFMRVVQARDEAFMLWQSLIPAGPLHLRQGGPLMPDPLAIAARAMYERLRREAKNAGRVILIDTRP